MKSFGYLQGRKVYASARYFEACFGSARFFLLLLGLLFSTLVPAPADQPHPFRVGEKLTYHFYWGFFMVGRGTFEVKELEKNGNYIFTVRAQSNDMISAMFPVNDEISSFFDPKQMRSARFTQNRKEGESHVWEETFFYYPSGKGNTKSYVSGEDKWFEIPKDKVQDKLSTIYYMRILNWKDREKASVILGNDKRNYNVTMTKLKTEELELDDFKPIPSFLVEPNTEYMAGFVKKGHMTVWVSNDDFKIPLQVIANLPFGTVSAKLVKVEGVDDWPYNHK